MALYKRNGVYWYHFIFEGRINIIYKMKFFPLMPIIFILAYLFVAISITIDDPKAALTGVAVLAAFVLLYFLVHYKKKNNLPTEN